MANSIEVKTSESPRFEGRTLKWYYKNTFPYSMTIELVDSETLQPIDLGGDDRIDVCFFDKRDNPIHTFTFNNLTPYEIGGKQYIEIVLDFNDEVSAKFAVGKYTYCTTYYGERTSTIWANAEAEVEICH